MADVIHKYGPFVRHIPVEFKGQPLHVGIHTDGEIYLWCRTSAEGPHGRPGRAILVYTGEEYTGAYIGTVVTRIGVVYHAVEEL